MLKELPFLGSASFTGFETIFFFVKTVKNKFAKESYCNWGFGGHGMLQQPFPGFIRCVYFKCSFQYVV